MTSLTKYNESKAAPASPNIPKKTRVFHPQFPNKTLSNIATTNFISSANGHIH